MTDVNNNGETPSLVPWLQDLPLPPAPQRRAAQAGSDESELPTWLDGITQLPPATTPRAAATLPSWLAGIDDDDGLVGGRVGAVQRSAAQAPPTAWRDRQAAATEAGQDVPASEMPEWLARLAARRNASAAGAPGAAAPETPASPAAVGGDSELPGWLRAQVEREAAFGVAPQSDEAAAAAAVSPNEQVPPLDWLRDIEEAWAAETRRNTTDAHGRDSAPDPDVAPDVPAVSVLVPDWLQPAEPRRSPPPADAARAILQRAGLLPPRSDGVMTQPVAPMTVRRTPETQAAIDALTELVQADLPVPPPDAAVSREFVRREAVVPLLLLVAALVLVLLPPGLFPRPAGAVPVPSIDDLTVGFGPGQEVIVAVEWGAARAPQLRDGSEQLITALSSRGARTLVVATDPVGAAMSTALTELSSAAAAVSPLVVFPEVIGFLPGADLAVRRLAAAPPTATAPAAVFVVADDLSDVRAWIEQWWVNQPAVPLTLLLPQDIAVQALPYQGIDGVTLIGSNGPAAAAGADERTLPIAFAVVVVLGAAGEWALRRAAVRRRGHA